MRFCKFCKIVADLCSHGSMATFQQLHGCRVCEMSCWQLIALLGKLQKQEQAISIFISQKVHWFRALTPVKFASVPNEETPLTCANHAKFKATVSRSQQFKRSKIIRILFSLISWLHSPKSFPSKPQMDVLLKPPRVTLAFITERALMFANWWVRQKVQAACVRNHRRSDLLSQPSVTDK